MSGLPAEAWEDDDDDHSSPASAGPPNTSSAHSSPYTELEAVQEIPEDRLANMDPEQVVVDKVNYLADYPTRGNLTWQQIQDMWQTGPDFLMLPRPAWPTSRDFVPTLPAEERRKRYLEASVLNVYNTVASINAVEDRDKIPKAESASHPCSQQVVSGLPSSAWEDDDDNHSSPVQTGPPHTSSARSDSSDIPEPGPEISEAPRQHQRLEWSSSPLPPTEGSSQ